MEAVHYDDRACRFVARLQQDDYLRLDEIIRRYRDKPGYLIPALKDAQALFGFLPWSAAIPGQGAENINQPHFRGGDLLRLFYHRSAGPPRGALLHGDGLLREGGGRHREKDGRMLSIKVGETTRDLSFSLEVVRCVGACGLAPVIFVDSDVHAQLHPEKIDGILHRY